MTKQYCDICGVDLVESNMENLLGSRQFVALDANSEKIGWDLTLCCDCKETMYYFMQNPDALKKCVSEMKLGNRIRFLLKMKLAREA